MSASKKHAGALHDCYTQENDGAARSNGSSGLPATGRGMDEQSNNSDHPVVTRKTNFIPNNVLLRTSAVRVVNPCSGNPTLAYAQHDTASQPMLVSERLTNELQLNVDSGNPITTRTLTRQATKALDLRNFRSNRFQLMNFLMLKMRW